jgi:hypothetical protein
LILQHNLNYHVSDDDFSHYGLKLTEFSKTIKQDFFVSMLEYNYDGKQIEEEMKIARTIRDLGYKTIIEHFENNAFYIEVYDTSLSKMVALVFARISRRVNYSGDIFEPTKAGFYIRISGAQAEVSAICDALRQPIKNNPTIKWYFLNEGRTETKTIDIEQKHPVHDAMYPWINDGVQAYFKRYLESEANILILLGEPGTGKTTFIRELLVRNNLEAMITYEEHLMNSDKLYIDLITDDQDILIMEDADTMLLSREQAGNKTMSKLLNISDGLMKNTKKIIFTANLEYNTLNQTDHALIRPGRCFDVLDFRAFTKTEAEAAAQAMGLPMPEMDRSETITLAKLTNPNYVKPETQKVGFR